GIEDDTHSLAAVKLTKKGDTYSLVCCGSDVFPAEAYFEGELTTEYVGGVDADIIKENNLGRFLKLGFTSYNELDVA
ncbi:type IV pili, partial [Francisella tularensis subsp. holarctica]|nr:type IV pili [Francisella tularensis subsp. holarctica]